MEKEKFINTKLSKYVKFWKHDIEQNATFASKQAQDGSIYGILGGYSITFVKILLRQSSILLEDFCLSSN
jgi:hypothetical protein